jgi:hypothetical protein
VEYTSFKCEIRTNRVRKGLNRGDDLNRSRWLKDNSEPDARTGTTVMKSAYRFILNSGATLSPLSSNERPNLQTSQEYAGSKAKTWCCYLRWVSSASDRTVVSAQLQ